jgi:hypothetical protein
MPNAPPVSSESALSLKELLILYVLGSLALLLVLVVIESREEERDLQAWQTLCGKQSNWESIPLATKKRLRFPIQTYAKEANERECLEGRLLSLKAELRTVDQTAPPR